MVRRAGWLDGCLGRGRVPSSAAHRTDFRTQHHPFRRSRSGSWFRPGSRTAGDRREVTGPPRIRPSRVGELTVNHRKGSPPVGDPHATQEWCRAFFAQLVECGVVHVAASPGSRSTPLTVAADRTAGLEISMHLDERSGGFFALGLARATRRPVALLCTSGTAAANYLPAVIEAFHYGVSLIVLTSDRPPELQGIGAPQTIDQNGLYGTAVRWSTTTAVAGTQPAGEAVSVAHQAFVRATRPAAGPVHVNVPLREPLEPPSGDPQPVGLMPVPPNTDTPETGCLDDLFNGGPPPNGLLVIGPMDPTAEDREALARLARATGWPMLADPTSGCRRGPHVTGAPVLAMGDHLLRSSWSDRHRPDVVVQMGAMPTSKGYQLWLDRVGAKQIVSVDHLGRHPDAARRITDRVTARPGQLAHHLLERFAKDPLGTTDWTAAWTEAEHVAVRVVNELVDEAPFDEPAVIRSLDRSLPEAVELVVGNSMPIRDVDAFLPVDERRWSIRGNRGANGIDGQVSTAAGIAAGSDVPTVLLAGDLTVLHDLGGLTALQRLGVDLTVVVVDNGGGGIFSFLPIATEPHVDHRRLFHTPHGLNIARAAELAGATTHSPSDPKGVDAALNETVGTPGPHLIHVRTDSKVNVELHRAAAAAVDDALTGGQG
ncbi:MAG: 2-succinyl-5-enolpyruvyl-6-hydroxy-3-cyclohexene-1-carboxylic-acid synthase [Acidimicrobiaceae bacterium]|nr:2-succinyl-5-enolpyruvyl-6-hydroxy-3-cyclohexene-1-carboxylic-acid synthase [Acidimicrobiaceae bacterium]